jgi:hypothetical protein
VRKLELNHQMKWKNRDLKTSAARRFQGDRERAGHYATARAVRQYGKKPEGGKSAGSQNRPSQGLRVTLAHLRFRAFPPGTLAHFH